MKNLLIANLKNNWHGKFNTLNSKAHEILDKVSQVLFCADILTIEEAKETLENEGYYFYLPPWDDSCDVEENFKALEDFCNMLNELRNCAFPLTIEVEDVESFNTIEVTEKFFNRVQKVDLTDIRANDLVTIEKLANLTI